MARDDLNLIRELKTRIAELFALYEAVENENRQLGETIRDLKQKLAVLEEEKSKLAEKYENLRIAGYWKSGYEDKQVARKKVNKLLREIDKCIALLNK
jgi:predicted nuclease with TOPRIM domain